MIPLPGKRVRGSRTGKPVMAFLDLIGRRWALRVLWEMHTGPARFRDLQTACGASPTVINRRLGELKAWDLVITDGRWLRADALGERVAHAFVAAQRLVRTASQKTRKERPQSGLGRVFLRTALFRAS